MRGACWFRRFRLFFLLASAVTLFAVPGTSIWAQELDVPDTTDEAKHLAEETVQELEDQVQELEDQVGGAVDDVSEALQQPPTSESDLSTGNLGGGTHSAPASSPASRSSTGAAPRGQSRSGRPRIAIQKTNDADENGVFTSSEVARGPGQDVAFHVSIKNVGPTTVTIRRITDIFDEHVVEVCRTLIGDRVPPGRTARCTFGLESYAPPRGDTQENALVVVVKETDGQRTASDSDASRVTTLGRNEEVRGAEVTNPNMEAGGGQPFAFSGVDVHPQIAVALALIGTGAILIRVGRRPA